MKPDEIEKLSFQIIDREAGSHNFTNDQWIIVRRMIHTSADFEYKETVRFHRDAVTSGLNAIREGKNIITDTNMARVGIRKMELDQFGATVTCYMNDSQVRSTATATGASSNAAHAVLVPKGGRSWLGIIKAAPAPSAKASPSERTITADMTNMPASRHHAAARLFCRVWPSAPAD